MPPKPDLLSRRRPCDFIYYIPYGYNKINIDNCKVIAETNTAQLMGESNVSLSANLTAKVGFTQNAIDNSITSYINNNNVKIYQTFLVSLNRLNGSEGSNQRGMLVDPTSIALSNYRINGEEPDDYVLAYKQSSSYVELMNGHSIKDELREAGIHPVTTNEGKDYTITITNSVSLTYSAGTLSVQFPKSTADHTTKDGDTGTYMIGFSNISSTSDGGAMSRASANTEQYLNEDTGKRLLYYVDDNTSVDFSYNAVANSNYENDGNGNYGQLGLDGKELDEANENYVQINSAAYYDTQEYNQKSFANYVKVTVKLSKKGDGYNTALEIPTYLSDFELLDSEGNEITSDDEDTTVVKNSADHIYTYIIPKDRVETTDDVYYIPINFKAHSGKNTSFEQKNNGDGMQYSNYKVLINVGLLRSNSVTETPLQNSEAYDHIIYTNAKLHSDVIDEAG